MAGMNTKEYRFLHFILSRIDLYKREYDKFVVPHEDFIIDFPTKSLHAKTPTGLHFIQWMKDIDQKVEEDYKIIRKTLGGTV